MGDLWVDGHESESPLEIPATDGNKDTGAEVASNTMDNAVTDIPEGLPNELGYQSRYDEFGRCGNFVVGEVGRDIIWGGNSFGSGK